MKANRVVRIIFALIVLILFGAYSYFHFSVSPHSSDLDNPVQATAAPSEVTAEPVSAEPTATPEPTPEPTPGIPNVDISSWEFVLVNTENTVDASFAPPEVVGLSDSKCPVDSRIADALTAFANAASAEGLPVYLSSGYRSYNEQAANLQRKLDQGYSYDIAITIVAAPGTSEHQTGLCCDITDVYHELKTPSELEQTATYIWMSEHCQEYGFIVRYPKGKEDVTGIIYEPWHFRYVGVDAATYIMENDITLEEFVALYQ